MENHITDNQEISDTPIEHLQPEQPKQQGSDHKIPDPEENQMIQLTDSDGDLLSVKDNDMQDSSSCCSSIVVSQKAPERCVVLPPLSRTDENSHFLYSYIHRNLSDQLAACERIGFITHYFRKQIEEEVEQMDAVEQEAAAAIKKKFQMYGTESL